MQLFAIIQTCGNMAGKFKRSRVHLEVSIHWRYLHQDQEKTWKEIARMKDYKKYSKATICRHMKKPINDTVIDKRRNNKGRPRKLTARDKRNILRQVEILRRDYGYFTTKRLKVFAGVSPEISDETVRRVLRDAGFKYTHSRKKGILSRKDLKTRLEFAKTVRRRLAKTVWTEGVAFYLDGVGFTHKYNPHDQALAPRTMAWRRPADGLSFQQTSKGSHEGCGGKTANFFVAIAYKKGVILAEQYEGQLNGQSFAEFVREQFPTLFERSSNPKGKLFLQDGDPSQNSRKAQEAMYQIGAKKFSIPARSPDLNPIENVFHNIKSKMRDDAFNKGITNETYSQFCARAKETLQNYPSEIIDRTIMSMDKRIDLVIKAKGQRIRY